MDVDFWSCFIEVRESESEDVVHCAKIWKSTLSASVPRKQQPGCYCFIHCKTKKLSSGGKTCYGLAERAESDE